MNYANTLVIVATIIIWSQIIQWTVPTSLGRSILGIFGAVFIGVTFAAIDVTVFSKGGFVLQ